LGELGVGRVGSRADDASFIEVAQLMLQALAR